MYIPPNPILNYYSLPVLIDSRITIADPFYMSQSPLQTSDQEDLYINDPDHSQKYYNMITTLVPEDRVGNMRRQSSCSSTVTMAPFSSTLYPPLHQQVMSTSTSSSSSIYGHNNYFTAGQQGNSQDDDDNDEEEESKKKLNTFQDKLDTIYDEWISVDIVYRSLQTAFPVRPLVHLSPEERLEDIDRELSIAYDDLMTQVRRLYRNINRLSREMAQCNIEQQQLQELQQLQQRVSNVHAASTTGYCFPPSGTGLTPP
ncbi:hypothetical protein INT45_007529 [Circinella minor]|uniref:Uncharacterized protein n=1 Tax=Circinella minor TaxID=1195481 RepID=A0A8H7SG66_9FUNG|nr:hypothetical protein INT45_007529 [Circinella minor]